MYAVGNAREVNKELSLFCVSFSKCVEREEGELQPKQQQWQALVWLLTHN